MNQGGESLPVYHAWVMAGGSFDLLIVGPDQQVSWGDMFDEFDSEFDNADNDGAVTASIRTGEFDATFAVDVQNAPAGALVNVWVDFDGDKNWASSSEHVADDLPVEEGLHEVHFNVPPHAIAGNQNVRFRLSTAANVGIGGHGPDGEVEDYVVEILPPAASHGEFVPPSILANFPDGTFATTMDDLDGDGDLDIAISTMHEDGHLLWLENDGAASFSEHLITDSADFPRELRIADMDGDGDRDLIGFAFQGENALTWFENRLPESFLRHDITHESPRQRILLTGDLDLDGDLDLITGSEFLGGEVLRNFTNVGGEFSPGDLRIRATSLYDGVLLDMSATGLLDIVVDPSQRNVQVHDGLKWAWTSGDQVRGPDSTHLSTGDFNQDGIADIVGSGNPQGAFGIHWLDSRQPRLEREWQHLVELSDRATIEAADIDGDGDWDIVYRSYEDSTIGVYVNFGGQFENRVLPPFYDVQGDSGSISTWGRRRRTPMVGDLDGDGDLDIAVAAGQEGTLAWYENIENTFVVSAVEPGLFEDSAEPGEIVIQRLGSAFHEQTVRFQLLGTAQYGDDYQVNLPIDVPARTGSVVFPSGRETISLFIQPIDNPEHNPIKSVVLALIDQDAYLLADGQSTAAIMLTDNEPTDYGDAPIRSFAHDDGARHVAIGPTLGALRDVDDNGLPSDDALGDDQSGVMEDDDGVSFGALRIGHANASFTVEISSAPQGARVDAWIDFNRNGIWGDWWWEQIAYSATAQEGTNVLFFDIPASLLPGGTYARVRLSTAGELLPYGLAVDGEVEDYLVTLEPPQHATGLFASQSMLGEHRTGNNVTAVDFDVDGDIDIVAGSTWFQNQGAGDFVQSTFFDSDAVRAQDVLVTDINRDGAVDFVGRSAWYENRGSDTAFFYRPISNRGEATWSGDLDADGDLDFIFIVTRDHAIHVHENNGDQTFTDSLVDERQIEPSSVAAYDLDNDGDLDLVGSGRTAGELFWYEHVGQLRFVPRTLAPNIHGSETNDIIGLAVGDLDGDGDLDVMSVAAFARSLRWSENDGAGNFTTHSIAQDLDGGFALRLVDLDGDADLDGIVSVTGENRVVLVENVGSATFSIRTLIAGIDNVRSADVGDFDEDGDLDLVVSTTQRELYWYSRTDFVPGDFNLDGTLDGDDIDALSTAVVRASDDLWFDTNDDGLLSGDDVAVWITELFGSTLGDANLDFRVDALDFQILKSHLFTFTQTWREADFNTDGQTDVQDFNIWNDHRFAPPPAAAAHPRKPREPLAIRPFVVAAKDGPNHSDRRVLDNSMLVLAEPSGDEPLPTHQVSTSESRSRILTSWRRNPRVVDATFAQWSVGELLIPPFEFCERSPND